MRKMVIKMTGKQKKVLKRNVIGYSFILSLIHICTERKTFNLGEIGRGLTPGARKKGLDYAELLKDYCAISEYGDYIVKLSCLLYTSRCV